MAMSGDGLVDILVAHADRQITWSRCWVRCCSWCWCCWLLIVHTRSIADMEPIVEGDVVIHLQAFGRGMEQGEDDVGVDSEARMMVRGSRKP